MTKSIKLNAANILSLKKKIDKIYLSLGDREAKTKNPVMATVEDKTRGISECYKAKGYDVFFEMNQGGHFTDPELRTAKGIKWILK